MIYVEFEVSGVTSDEVIKKANEMLLAWDPGEALWDMEIEATPAIMTIGEATPRLWQATVKARRREP